MARKIENILLGSNMREFFKLIEHTRSFTEEQALEILTKEEFKALQKRGYIESNDIPIKAKQLKKLHEEGAISKDVLDKELKSAIKQVRVFSRTGAGTTFSNKHHGTKQVYGSNSYVHDVFLTSKKMKLIANVKEGDKELKFQSESVSREKLNKRIAYMRKNKLSEYRAIQDKYEEKCPGFIEKMREKEFRNGSAPDMCYRNPQGKWVAYEVTTVNYDHFKRCLKEFSAEILGYEYETYDV